MGLGAGRPLLILSGNGVDHLLMTLGAMTARIPVALDAVGDLPAIVAAGRRPGARQLAELTATPPGPQVAEAFALLAPSGITKILFTFFQNWPVMPRRAYHRHRA